MPATNRLEEIVALVHKRGFLSVKELSRIFAISEVTIGGISNVCMMSSGCCVPTAEPRRSLPNSITHRGRPRLGLQALQRRRTAR